MVTNKIVHYLLERVLGGHMAMVRMFGTDPARSMKPDDIAIAQCYETSVVEKRIVDRTDAQNRIIDKIFALNAGSYRFGLLEALGVEFTAMVIKNSDLVEVSRAMYSMMVNKANFMFANSEYSYFFMFDGEVDFGLNVLGLTVEEQKKSAKRLQEICRMVEGYLFYKGAEAVASVRIAFPVTTGPAAYYDGHSYMAYSYAVQIAESIEEDAVRQKMIREIYSGKLSEMVFRLIGPKFMIKGNLTLVPDAQCKFPDGSQADIATHPINLKTELKSQDWMYVTMWEHEHTHLAVHDGQTEVTLGVALTAKAMDADIQRLVDQMRTIKTSGKLPASLDASERSHNNDGKPNVAQLSGSYNKASEKWQAAGYNICLLQNFPWFWLNGKEMQMRGEMEATGQFYKKLWVPMTNATLVSVVTWESAVEIGGFTFAADQHRRICFYDKRVGFIMPGQRFVEILRYIGGGDLDDQLKVLRVKVWFSDPAILAMHLGKTIPAASFYTCNEMDAREMVLIMRSPNATGEWALVECDTMTLPIPAEMRHDDLTIIKIDDMPLPADLLETQVNYTGRNIVGATNYSNQSMTRAFAIDMIETQMGDPTDPSNPGNPGVGSVCNPLIVYASARPYNLPIKMVAELEKMVDTLEMGHDRVWFKEIKDGNKGILDSIIGSRIDRYIAMTRIGSSKTRANYTLFNGRYTKTHAKYVEAIETIHNELLLHTLQMRAKIGFIHEIIEMPFSDSLKEWAANYWYACDQKLTAIKSIYNTRGVDNVFAKMTIEQNSKLAMEAFVDEMVNNFLSLTEEECDRHILALWQFIVSPHEKGHMFDKNQPYGISDRILCQPSGAGKLSMMDLLMDTLSRT